MQNRFENTLARIRDFRLHGVRFSKSGRVHITGITVQGCLAVPSPSFWKAIMRQFDVVEKSVRDLDKDELFQELLNESPDQEIEFGMTTDDEGNAFLTGPILDDFSADPDADLAEFRAGWERPEMQRSDHFTTPDSNRAPRFMSGPDFGPRPSMN